MKFLSAVRRFFFVQAAQADGVEELVVSACDESWVAFDAGDQPAAVARHRESREGPELSGSAVSRHLMRALEADYRLRVAVGQQLIGPDARVTLRIIGQTGVAVLFVRMSVSALDISRAAGVAIGVETELILAGGTAERGKVSLAIATVDGPVIVAVAVDGSMAVEEETVLAVLEGQGAVRAEEEGIAILRMSVRVHAVGIRAGWPVQ